MSRVFSIATIETFVIAPLTMLAALIAAAGVWWYLDSFESVTLPSAITATENPMEAMQPPEVHVPPIASSRAGYERVSVFQYPSGPIGTFRNSRDRLIGPVDATVIENNGAEDKWIFFESGLIIHYYWEKKSDGNRQ